MTEKKEDLRIARTKESIKKAFKELVCELPYEKVTVKAIADRARINRNTFYLNYNCMDDVLAEIQAKHSSEYSAIVSGIDQLKETGKLVRAFFEYMEAQDDFFKRVTCDSRFDYIRERMQNRVTKQAAESRPLKGLDQSVRNILLTFNNCVVLLYRQWVADGRKIPMEEMIELATTLLEKGMRGFRNR
ncbi:TetR/AcrR family transcriptional regulator [uncultured Treponema sp.]|uniref:TetR/AcrR family transcriptional regulator n=1 Tax=uncultured Treponema sp. TaxID=162155 RepID=UPI0025DBA825|nr:TetR/AcrR family transcriptional regulator [uncultured Treponema sp.]